MTASSKFEGTPVKGAAVSVTGTTVADRSYHEGERVLLTVQAVVTTIKHGRNKDDALIRTHTCKVVRAAEAPARLSEVLVESLQAAEDERDGKTPLDFPDEQEA